jgi:hypothetical protein
MRLFLKSFLAIFALLGIGFVFGAAWRDNA